MIEQHYTTVTQNPFISVSSSSITVYIYMQKHIKGLYYISLLYAITHFLIRFMWYSPKCWQLLLAYVVCRPSSISLIKNWKSVYLCLLVYAGGWSKGQVDNCFITNLNGKALEIVACVLKNPICGHIYNIVVRMM